MEKRTIVYVILISLLFVGFNLYFSHDRDKKTRARFAQDELVQEKQQEEISQKVAEKTATLAELPLIQIYETQSGGQPIAKGINVQGNTLVLAWKRPLPQEVFVSTNGGRARQLLQTKKIVARAPALYAPQDFENLLIANVPEEGIFDLQLVSFPKEAQFPKVTWATYVDGTLKFPQGKLKNDAIALYKTETGYLPLGYYEATSDVFVELQTLPFFSEFATPVVPTTLPAALENEQKYYVLENAYQQLVFTNVGGALSEINLPFESATNDKSVVKEIGFDREIQEDSPKNARFPLLPYFAPGSTTEQPGALGGYYPLIRRGILAKNSKNNQAIAPEYYALNVVSNFKEVATLLYDVKEFTKDKIVFEALQPHRKIIKTYSIAENASGAPYVLDLTIQVEGDTRGLWLTSGLPEVEIMSRTSSPRIQYRLSRRGKKADVEKLNLPKPKEEIAVSSVSPDWAVNSNGYLGIISDPLSQVAPGFRAAAVPGDLVPTRLTLIDPKYHPYKASSYPGYEVLFPLPQTNDPIRFRIYAGPFEESVLKKVDTFYTNSTSDYNPHYISCRTFYGWFSFISEPFAKFLYIVMSFFHSITNSWGFSIILLTVFLRLLLYPLNAWSIKSMRRMQDVSPQVQAVQAKYKKEPKKAQMEVMKIYRQHKVNPFMGCLPIVIQIPFLIGMFDLLKSSFQLRGAVFIPGWINNLTAPDVLFSWDRPIFFIGNQFHLLPILLGIVMFFQQRISQGMQQKKKGNLELTDQQRQQKSMGTVMTVVFTVLFYHFPSGLNLYWLSSMILGIGQQWFTNRMLDRKNKGVVSKGKA